MLLLWIKSQPGFAYKSVVYIKKIKIIFKEIILPYEFILCLSGISLGRYNRKVLPKAGVSEKR